MALCIVCSWFETSSPKSLLNELFLFRGELLRKGNDKLDDEVSSLAWAAVYWHPFTWYLLTVRGTRSNNILLTLVSKDETHN